MTHCHIPTSSNSSPKRSKRSGKRENNTLIDNHRHRKVFKTRSHTNKLSQRSGQSECNQSNYDHPFIQKVISIDRMPAKSQHNGKKCLHKTKSDFGGKSNGPIIDERQVVPIDNFITLSNNLLDNTPVSNTTNVPKISAKQPLKKSNTFPYEKLHSDTTSCSSENESIGCEKNYEQRNTNNVAIDKRLNEDEESYNLSNNVYVRNIEDIRNR